MNKKKTIKIGIWLTAIVTVLCLALLLKCNRIVVNKAIPDSLIVHEKESEKYYMEITNPLGEIIDGNNSFDYVPINNSTIAWYKKSRTTLIKVYDSNHAASELSDSAKVDSLFMELKFHFDLDNEEELNKHTGIRNQRMKKTIILYRITENTLLMLERHDNFENELLAWDRMQMALEEFYLTAKELLYTGGSGSDVLCLMAMNAIYKNRDDDLKRMQQGKSSTARDILTARNNFIHSIDSVEKEITEEFTKEEWNSWKDIPQLIDKMHKARNPLIKAFDEWIVERKKYDGCANSIMDLNQTISGER